MFADPRVVQFHDPEQLLGNELTKNAFRGWADTVAARMVPDDPMLAHLKEVRDAPTWDAYLFYGAEARWAETLPRPASWIRHAGRQDDGSSRGWINDFSTPLRSFDLREEMQRLGDAWVEGDRPMADR